jgi:hypothetical protein
MGLSFCRNVNGGYLYMRCNGCQERQIGCHATCLEYKEFRKKIDERTQVRLGIINSSKILHKPVRVQNVLTTHKRGV